MLVYQWCCILPHPLGPADDLGHYSRAWNDVLPRGDTTSLEFIVLVS